MYPVILMICNSAKQKRTLVVAEDNRMVLQSKETFKLSCNQDIFMFKMKCSDFHSQRKSPDSRLICPIVTVLLMSQSHSMTILGPRALDKNHTKQCCLERTSELASAFGRACCGVEARSAVCQWQWSGLHGCWARQREAYQAWHPRMGKSLLTSLLWSGCKDPVDSTVRLC